MKLSVAMDIINSKPRGFRVSFERKSGCFLVGGMFPDEDEPSIETEEQALKLAEEFARATRGQYVNIYVIDGHTYQPVNGYQNAILNLNT